MAIKYADRVLETSTTQGTGTLNLIGATSGFQSFVDGVGDDANVSYFISDGQSWESGIGHVTSGTPDTLSRDRIIDSSEGGSPINWGPGVRNVFLSASATMLLWRDENGNNTNEMGASSGTANAHIVEYGHTIAAYSDRMRIVWLAPADNTGNVTVNVNELGAKSYVRRDETEFPSGQVKAGQLQEGFYIEAIDKIVGNTVPREVSTNDVQDGAITGPKLGAKSVGNSKLADAPAYSIKLNPTAVPASPSDLELPTSRLIGRGSSGGTGLIDVGGNLSFSGSTLRSSVLNVGGSSFTGVNAFALSGIPAGVNTVDLLIQGASTNGTNQFAMQLVVGGGTISSGYVGSAISSNGAGNSVSNHSSGFVLESSSTVAADDRYGRVTLRRSSNGGNLWFMTSELSVGSRGFLTRATGCVNVGAELTGVLFRAGFGSDVFDAGAVYVSYSH
jgi:hypothetical protein